MSVQRISVKLFVHEPAPADLVVFVSIFQRWIQEHRVEGLLIDVADYKHVFQGPGIVLIGHEGDYAVDNGRGEVGLLYTHKRDLKDKIAEELVELMRLALTAGRLLEQDEVLGGSFRLRTDAVEIAFLDRLRWPNQPEIPSGLAQEIRDGLAHIFPGQELTLESMHSDARQPLTVRVQASEVTSMDTLLTRVGQAAGAAVSA